MLYLPLMATGDPCTFALDSFHVRVRVRRPSRDFRADRLANRWKYEENSPPEFLPDVKPQVILVGHGWHLSHLTFYWNAPCLRPRPEWAGTLKYRAPCRR